MATNLADIPGIVPADETNRIMLLLVGKPFTGKTWAAATFPNPIFLDFDHKAKSGTLTFPFWQGEFCDKYARRTNPNYPPNGRDALLYFLQTALHKIIPPNATIIIDSGTALEAAFHTQTEKVETPPLGKGGKPDGFYVWNQKMRYFPAVFSLLKLHAGHVVYIMHEQDERDTEGALTGRIKPLMSGSFVDQIASHFTAMFRQRVEITPGQPAKYVWDVRPTRAFECNNTFQCDHPTVLATYESIKQYFPKYPTTL